MKTTRGSIGLPIALALGALALLLIAALLVWPTDSSRPFGAPPVGASLPAPAQGPDHSADDRSSRPSSEVASGSESSLPTGTDSVADAAPTDGTQLLSQPGRQSGPDPAERNRAERPRAPTGPVGRTQIIAEMDGDGSQFVLPAEDGTDRQWSGMAEMQAAVFNAGTPADVKQDILADVVPLFATDGEAIGFLRTVATDAGQPEEVRVDAVSKLADFGLQHVEALGASDSAAIQEEVDLIKRLEDYRRQEGLPVGSVRSGFQ